MVRTNTKRAENEPNTAPLPHTWYNITLGNSFKDHYHRSSSMFCTLRYDFKPASIDKSQGGILHKSKDNRVTLEFQNNLRGKPRITYEGGIEDCKENDAVLFFDGKMLRLDRLHQTVGPLRHVRFGGESLQSSDTSTVEPFSTLASKEGSLEEGPVHQNPVEVIMQIDPTGSEGLIGKRMEDSRQTYESRDHVDFLKAEESNDCMTAKKEHSTEDILHRGLDIDINIPLHMETSDDEIADVDGNEEEPSHGSNAAQALRAQVNAASAINDQTLHLNSSSESVSDTASTDSVSSECDSTVSI